MAGPSEKKLDRPTPPPSVPPVDPPALNAGVGGLIAGSGEAIAVARTSAQAGDRFYAAGDLLRALGCYADAVGDHPAEPRYHYRLGITAWKCSEPELAERHLCEAVRLAPGYVDAHDALGQWFLEIGRLDEAEFHSAAAAKAAPQNVGVQAARASVLLARGQADAARALIDPLLASGVVHDRLALAFARLAPKCKRESEAVELLLRASRTLPLPAPARRLLHFAAAGLFDKIERYDEAFAQARLGNELARQPYSPDRNRRRVDDHIAYFTRERLARLPSSVQALRRPVVIVGMPRSGTTLVEQILSSHPDVAGGGEMMALGDIVWKIPQSAWAKGRPYPHCLDLLTPLLVEQMADQYAAAIAAVSGAARYITDKMPANHWHLGLLQHLMPQCHVIHCVRDPLDTCLSCYLTEFSVGNAFTCDLGDLGAYWRDYSRLMEHWNATLSLPMLTVRYEDVVEDIAGQTRRLLDFLDLGWDDRCLKFHENQRVVSTASHEQVRRPLYRSSVGRWKNYEKHLGPLRAACGV